MYRNQKRSVENDNWRRQAEEVFRDKVAHSEVSLDDLSPQETQLMLHELCVHQIELDRQNEALRRSQLARPSEIEVGTGVNRSMRCEMPENIKGAWLAVYAESSPGINGDFYALHHYRPSCFEVLVGDVTETAGAAALIGAGIINAYKDVIADLSGAAETGTPVLPTPAEIVNAMRRRQTQQLVELSSVVTLALYRFDLDAGTLTWVNAGHTPGLLTSGFDARPVAISGSNPPIGDLPKENYVQLSVAVQPGDSLLLFSDGFTEASSAAGEVFGLERLCDLLEPGIMADLPPATILCALRGEHRRFTGGGPATDDQTVLMIKLHPRRHIPRGGIEDRVEPFVFTLPWSLEGLGGLRARIQDCSLIGSEEDAATISQAGFEAATNAIRCSRLLVGDATLTCRIRREGDTVAVELIYPSAVLTSPAQTQPNFSEASECGFDQQIIERSVDSVEYSSPMPGIASIRLLKAMRQPDGAGQSRCDHGKRNNPH